MTDLWNQLLINPIINLLIAFYKMFSGLGLPGALGFSILLLTVLVRLILWPLTAKQLQSAKKMSDLRPQLEELKKLHGKDKMRYQQEQMKLYQKHGVNPASGCLPLLLQMPIFIALYNVFWSILDNSMNSAALTEKINNVLYSFPFLTLEKPLDLHFFGINLAAKPSDFQALGWTLLLIPPVTVVLQLLQSKMMMPRPVEILPEDKVKEKKEKQENEEMMVQLQGQMLFLMPLMFGFFAFQFPVGLALYWNAFTVLGMIQQHQISGWGGLTSWLPFLKNR